MYTEEEIEEANYDKWRQGQDIKSIVKRMEHAQDFMKGLCESLYGFENLDRVDEYIEEICHALDIDTEKYKHLTIHRIERNFIK
jgi:hypothetical protein